MSASTASPVLVLSRYFLSQMSSDAACIGMSRGVAAASTVVDLEFASIFFASRRTVLMLVVSPSWCRLPAPFAVNFCRANFNHRRRACPALRHRIALFLLLLPRCARLWRSPSRRRTAPQRHANPLHHGLWLLAAVDT